MITPHCIRHVACTHMLRRGVWHPSVGCTTTIPRGAQGRHTTAHTVLCGAAAPQHPLLKTLTDTQLQQMSDFLDILLETNKHLNLTAIRDKEEAWQRHIADSLALLPVIESALGVEGALGGVHAGEHVMHTDDNAGTTPFTPTIRLLDVGSGGGLPGMALAIARPHWHITMLDSLQKRCTFVNHAISTLVLPNAATLWARAEEAGQEATHREQYTVVVARAVAELRVLAEYCMPFVAPPGGHGGPSQGGVWVAAKGPAPDAEVASAACALRTLGGVLVGVEEVSSHSAEGARTAVVVRKIKGTPSKYPRKPGVPAKRPL